MGSLVRRADTRWQRYVKTLRRSCPAVIAYGPSKLKALGSVNPRGCSNISEVATRNQTPSKIMGDPPVLSLVNEP
jgi:hypothetical protein